MKTLIAVVLLLLGVVSLAGAQPVPGPGKCSASNLVACPSPFYNAPNFRSLAANVVAFGADPTGAADSTAAINAAIATGKGVYLPAGTYLITNTLSSPYSSCIFGDGPHASIIHVTSAFSPSATAVISLANTSITGAAVGPCVHDLQVKFDQPTTQTLRSNFASLGICTTGSGGTGCKYPPAIDDINAGDRVWIQNVTIGGAWTGIYFGATGDVHNVAFWLDNIEMGALNVGLSADGAEDWTHISGWHFWPFGLGGTTVSAVYEDGTTQSANIGRQDGLQVDDFVAIDSTFIVTADASGSLDGWRLNTLDLSSGAAVALLVQGGYQISVNNLHVNGTNVNGVVQVSGGNIHISNSFFPVFSGPTTGMIYQTAGNLEITDSIFFQSASTSSVYEAAGNLYMSGNYFGDSAQSLSAPLVNSAGGLINFTNNSASFALIGGVALLVQTDSVANIVRGNNFPSSYTYEFPCTNCSTAAGIYQTGAPGAGVMVSTSWSTGPVTSFPTYPAGLFEVGSPSSIDRIVINSVNLNVSGTVNVVLLNCKADASCSTSPITLASYTVAADGAASIPITVGQVSGPAYVAWEITGGTWSTANLTFLVTYHVN